MTRKRILVLAAGLVLWTAAAWLGLRGARLLWSRVAGGEPVAGSPAIGPAVPGWRWTPAERQAVERATRPGYRAALPADAAATPEREDLATLYGRYDPYLVRGDLNDDGRPDFVQVFVREREGAVLFDVVVFFGLEGGGFSAPMIVERAVALGNGDVAIDRDLVIVTPDLASDETYRYRLDQDLKKFVDVDAGSGSSLDDDAPDESPDQRPRARV